MVEAELTRISKSPLEPGEPRSSSREMTFITNLATHYRVRTFELIAKRYDANFVFYSQGGEASWLREHGISSGDFPHEYLDGFNLGTVRIAPRLIRLAW